MYGWPVLSHPNPQLSLIIYSIPYSVTFPPSYGTLLATPYPGHVPTPAHPQSTLGIRSFFSPSDQCSSFLFPKWQGLFEVFIVTPTSAKLDGLLHWIHLSHIKSFTPCLKTIFLCTYQPQQVPAPLSFRGHQDQSLFP